MPTTQGQAPVLEDPYRRARQTATATSDTPHVALVKRFGDQPSRLTEAVRKAQESGEVKQVVRESGHPPYPILFVHGLNGSDLSWATVGGELALDREWGWGTVFNASLNSDPNSTKLEDDVVTSFTNLDNCCSEASESSVFAVNFDVAYNNSTGEAELYGGNGLGRSNSNESAVIKQGYALEQAIAEILDATAEEKIILVGHSMGGLAIREYLQRKTSDGEYRWWIDPGEFQGHRVARVVTYGTPHRGSNVGSFSQIDLCGFFGYDCNTEAVRDLRWSYVTGQKGRYLYGGSEEAIKEEEGDPLHPNFGYYNYDVNADGDESNDVRGINVIGDSEPWYGTYSNPDMSLPLFVPYTWITSNPRGSGDGVVYQSRQWLYKFRNGERVTSPTIGHADSLLTNYCHADLPDLYCSQPRQLFDISGFVRGIDEPDSWSTAYRIPTDEAEGIFVDGYFTAPSGFPASTIDWDVYRYFGDGTGSATLSVPSNSNLSVLLSENGLLTGFGSLSEDGSLPLRITTSRTFLYSGGIFFRKAVSKIDAQHPYSFRVDTQELRHFSYEPRHGEFADTTDQGFATVFVPPEVPRIDGDPLETGDEIGVFTPGGTCVGAAVWNEAATFVTAFGNEEGGLAQGDSIHVRLWDRNNDTEYFVAGKLSGNEGRYEPGTFYAAENLEASNPIPVELARFTAKASGESSALLRWETASETNNAGFEVQHQPPTRKTWKRIGFVESKASGGTTTEPKSYRHAAKDLAVGTHRFRLKQVDLDGSSSLSEPKTAEMQMRKALTLGAPTPNPTSDQATLSFAVREESQVTAVLYNTIGQRVATLFKGRPTPGESQILHLDASRLPSGVYIVRLEANGRAETQRVTVVR